MKISELMDSIENRDVVLPEFQREYVWLKDQAKQLILSLYKEYPVGGLLFWKTDKPPELKNVDKLPDKLGTVTVILDGQQRLTTLYMLMRGVIPPYYRESDITNDPRDLYFNLDTAEFQYYIQTQMKKNPLWVRVADTFVGKEIDIFQIAGNIAKDGQDQKPFQLARRYNEHLNKLLNIKNMDLPTQTVPSHALMEDAITIFDLVNSQGTKLTDAELALTHVTGKWSQARRVMKRKIDELDKTHFYFDLNILTRSLVGVVCQRALFETIHSKPKMELETGWKRLSEILDYLVDILPNRAYVHSNRDLGTSNVLVPLIVYLSLNQNKFPDETAIKHAIHWLYAAQTWARYTSQTDQRLEQDISIILREANPWNALCDQIIDLRGRLDVKADDLDGRGIQHPLYNMAFILAKAQGAVDWSNGSSLEVSPGKPYTLQDAYIFPQSKLYGIAYDSDNHMHRKIVSGIANRVVLKTYHPYPDMSPDEYLPLVEAKFPGALSRQFIPMDPGLWKVSRFEDFLAARRELIALKINEFMHALISEPVIMHKRPLSELIGLGESATLEFKSTLQWDVVQNKQKTELRRDCMKTIVAFLNSSGGTLLIGVEDNGNVLGLEKDLAIIKPKSVDGFQQQIARFVSDMIGVEYSAYIKIRFEQLDNRTVCVVDVDHSSEPAYLKDGEGKEFYVRLASTSRKLGVEEAVQYIQLNW